MRKILYLLLFSFGFLQLLLPKVATAQAECGFTINLNMQPSVCLSDGRITVTLTNIGSNIDQNQIEYALNPIPPATRTITLSPDNVLSDIPPGHYNVVVKAFCLTSSSFIVEEAQNIEVTSTYVPMSVNIDEANSWKTGSCPTGRIAVTVTKGTLPYSFYFRKVGNPTWTPVTTTKTGDRYDLNYKFDEGNYEIEVVDNCGYRISHTRTVGKLSSDMPGIFSTDMYPGNIPCSQIRISFGQNSQYPDHLPIFKPSSGAYEVCFGYYDGSKYVYSAWQDYNTPYFYYDLPPGKYYGDFYTARIGYKFRLKGCTQEFEYSRTLAPSFYTRLLDGCDSYTWTNSAYGNYNLICYPYTLKVVNNTTGTVLENRTVPTSGDQSVTDLLYGTSYTITLTDANGVLVKTFNYNRTRSVPPVEVVYTDCGDQGDPITSAYIRVGTSGQTIKAGTSISVSGPSGGLMPGYTSARDETYLYWPYTQYGTSFSRSAQYLTPGEYTVTLTEAGCAPRAIKITVNANNYYYASNFTWTSKESCKGLEIYPSVTIKRGTTAVSPYFRIKSGPDGYDVNYIGAGATLILNQTGTYIIQAGIHPNVYGCGMLFDTITYTKRQMIIDAQSLGAYQCDGQTTGHIVARGINGFPPYKYELALTETGPAVQTQSGVPAGTTVHFNYGTANNTYYVRVIDSCNTSYPQSIKMVDLKVARIVFESNNGVVCPGDTIKLNALTLGDPATIQYNWTGPNGFTSNTQNPRILNASSAMSGYYYVTVTPQYCSIPVRDSAYVSVSPVTAAITPASSTTICIGGNVLLQATAGGDAYQWYEGTIPTLIPTATAANYTATTSGIYRVKIRKGNCTSDYSDPITVTQVNCAEAHDDFISIFACEQELIDVLANDVLINGAAGASVSIVTVPQYGTAAPSGGQVDYQVTGGSLGNCSNAGGLVDSFKYRVCKESNCDEALVIINILRVPGIILTDSCSAAPKLNVLYQYEGATYDWEYSNDSGTNWTTLIAGTNNPVYPATQEGLYKVTVHYNGRSIETSVVKLLIRKVKLPGNRWWYETELQ